MSLCQFIACDLVLPELFCSNTELSELEIVKCNVETSYKDIRYYTIKEIIYMLVWDYTDDSCIKLLDYLMRVGKNNSIEIWSIWLCNYFNIKEEINEQLKKIKVKKCAYNKLSFDILKSSVKCGDSGNTPNVLILN